jgi:hypothetical protein
MLRRTPGARDENGRWVEGGEVPGTFIATVQPAQKNDYDQLQTLPEGRRVERAVRIYTAERLNVAGEDASNGDILLWEGERYLVVAVSAWRTTMLKHYRYLASLEPAE